MFFATPAVVQFERMSSVLQAAPAGWKLMFLDGDKAWVYEMAKRGDKDFILLWQRYQENPTETMFDSIENGLKLIETGHNVIMIKETMLLGYLNTYPSKQDIHMINLGHRTISSILFYKNSPLLPMFKQGVMYLRETGWKKQMFGKWFWDLDQSNDSTPSEGHILTLGQMVTVFAMMLGVFIIALMVLWGELTYNQILKFIRCGQ